MGGRVRQPLAQPARYIQLPCPCCGQLRAAINGAHLRWLRERAQLDQRTFARRLGVSGPYVSDVERNRRDAPPLMVQAYLRLRSAKR